LKSKSPLRAYGKEEKTPRRAAGRRPREEELMTPSKFSASVIIAPFKLESINSASRRNGSPSRRNNNTSDLLTESKVDYQTYESFINTKTEDEDQVGPKSNFLDD